MMRDFKPYTKGIRVIRWSGPPSSECRRMLHRLLSKKEQTRVVFAKKGQPVVVVYCD